MAGCSHRSIARARRVLDDEHLTTAEQVAALTAEDVDRLFADGRKSVAGEFVAVDIDKVVAARLGRNKPPLKVLWARYLRSDAAPGARFYGCERFCQILAEHVRVNDLSLPVAHVPGHTMQVDWAGTPMQLTDLVTRAVTRVSVFVASLPFSGMVFAYGYREGRRSTVVTSQFDPEDWYRSLHDAVIAESILNRIVSTAELVQLDGPNMRRHTHQSTPA